ncbi:Ankyrin-repeat containing protein [Raphanus sativus]|nr:Ankyrin-repeat containing protein [Raphanus sativus]
MALSDSQPHRRSDRHETYRPTQDIVILVVFVVISVAVTFAMGFTCTKFYMGSAPDLDITGLVKKAVFMVFSFCNSITMLASVATAMHLIWAYHLSVFEQVQTALIRALALVTIALISMLVAFVVGCCLVVILLPWSTYS